MGLRDGTQVVTPGGKQPYPLSHLSSHSKTLFKECENGWLVLKADCLYLRFTLRPTDRQRQKQQTKVSLSGGNGGEAMRGGTWLYRLGTLGSCS